MRHLVVSSCCFQIPQSVFAFIIREHEVSLFSPLRVGSRSKHQKCSRCFYSVQPGWIRLILFNILLFIKWNPDWSMSLCRVKPYAPVSEAFFYNAEVFFKVLLSLDSFLFFFGADGFKVSFGDQPKELHSKDTLRIKPDKWANVATDCLPLWSLNIHTWK